MQCVEEIGKSIRGPKTGPWSSNFLPNRKTDETVAGREERKRRCHWPCIHGCVSIFVRVENASHSQRRIPRIRMSFVLTGGGGCTLEIPGHRTVLWNWSNDRDNLIAVLHRCGGYRSPRLILREKEKKFNWEEWRNAFLFLRDRFTLSWLR